MGEDVAGCLREAGKNEISMIHFRGVTGSKLIEALSDVEIVIIDAELLQILHRFRYPIGYYGYVGVVGAASIGAFPWSLGELLVCPCFVGLSVTLANIGTLLSVLRLQPYRELIVCQFSTTMHEKLRMDSYPVERPKRGVVMNRSGNRLRMMAPW